MNTILIYNDHIETREIDDSIHIHIISKNELFHVNTIKISIIKDSTVQIVYKSDEEVNLDVEIEVQEGVYGNIGETREGKKSKIRNTYFLKENSILNVNKFYHSESIKERNIIHLEGRGAQIEYHLKTISTHTELYETVVYHHAKETTCHIYNHAVNHRDGEVHFHVTNEVGRTVAGCEIYQNSRIITLNEKKCIIKPNLFMEENDVVAQHTAHIGSFEEEELFYLQSRGISLEKAKGLLIRGFLTYDIPLLDKDKTNKIIDTYWR